MSNSYTSGGALTGDPLHLDQAAGQADTLRASLADLEARGQSIGHQLGQTLGAALTGSRTLDQALKGLALRLSGMALSAGLKPLETLVGQALGKGFGALGSGLFGGLAAGAGKSVTPFAAGGIVAAPTYFATGSGTGLMGEAGAEAILPLKRGPDGALGVATGGGGGAAPIVFNVTTPDAESFRRSEADIAAMLARTVRRGQRHI